VRLTTNQQNTESKPNPNINAATEQHAVVRIQLNIVACPKYSEKFTRDCVAAFLPLYR